MAGVALPSDLATQIKYGAQTGSAVRRSQYLADALKALGDEGSKNIQSPGELAAKLLSFAILNHAGKSADKSALQSIIDQQNAESEGILAGLRPPTLPSTPSIPVITPQPPAAPAPAPTPPPEPPPIATAPPEPAPQPAPSNYTPQDRDALTRMLATEAIGEGQVGMAAAGHVALNRLKNGYGGAKSLSDVVYQPHQFEGMSRANQVHPEDYAKAGQVADQLLSGQVPDPTGGAMAFLNPDLQLKLGRNIPKWASGNDGHRIGNHVFFGGNPQQMAQNIAPPPPATSAPPPNPNTEDVAAVAAGSNPFTPPAPGVPSTGPGAAPVGVPPQAVPTGAGPANSITSEQIGLVEKLLKNPRTHDVGMAYAMELQKKAAEPTKFDVQMVNGVPVWADPYHPGQLHTGAVPTEAMTHVRTAQEAGIAAPPGTSFSVDPNGNVKQVYQPQNGQLIVSAPGQPYAEKPIPGGTNDPRAPAAAFANEEKLRDDYESQIKPYIAAREGYQKVIQAAKTGNPAGDIALVFGYMKTLDPNSTVREGEQAQVTNSGTIPQTITNMYNKMITGQGHLSPQQRSQFAASATQQFQVYQKTADALNERYGELAKSYQFAPEHVIRQFTPIEPYAPPADQRAPIPEAAQNAYRQRFQKGLIDPKAPMGSQQNPLQARDAATFHALDTPANKGKYVIGPNGEFGVIE